MKTIPMQRFEESEVYTHPYYYVENRNLFTYFVKTRVMDYVSFISNLSSITILLIVMSFVVKLVVLVFPLFVFEEIESRKWYLSLWTTYILFTQRYLGRLPQIPVPFPQSLYYQPTRPPTVQNFYFKVHTLLLPGDSWRVLFVNTLYLTFL